MRILYLDFLCPKGHLNLDINQIHRLSNIGDVIVVSQEGRYGKLPENVKNIEKKSIEIKLGKASNRLSSLKIMMVSAIESKKQNYDYIVVSSFETIMFSIGKLFFNRKDKIILIHHFNTDELSNKIKAFFFNTYMNKVKHIVLSEFIKEYLIKEFYLKPNNVFVVPHHMNRIVNNSNTTTIKKKEYRCIGLSNSNDEEIVSEIIQREKDQGLFKQREIKVVLKSKQHEFDNGYLKVVKGFLEKKYFDEYVEKTQSIYMPFSSSFQYRMSGTLIDALTNNKIVYGSDIPVIRQYSKQYQHICKIVNNADHFIKIVLADDIVSSDCAADFERFIQEHSEKRIENIFKEIFESDWN